MKLSIVIPVYDELFTVEQVIDRVRAVELPGLEREILVVDDGSTDGTAELLSGVEGIRSIRLPEHRGKGAAVRAGFAAASGDLLLIQDADLEYDPADYPRLLRPILDGHADVVYGSRFTGESRRVLYFWHAAINRALTLLANLATDLNLSDMTTCYKVFRREVLGEIDIESDGFEVEAELTAKVARRGARIYEVPISYHGRTYAEGKKIHWTHGLAMAAAILRHAGRRERSARDVGFETLRRLRAIEPYNRWLFERFRGELGQRVLEIGAGTGNMTRYLLDRERVVSGDTDPQYLATLRGIFDRYRRVRILPLRLPFDAASRRELADERLDTVVCLNVLEHVEDDAEALRSIRAALAPGGRLILLVPAHTWLYGSLDRALDHFRRYEKAPLVELLRASGFEIERAHHLNRPAVLGWWFSGRCLRRKVIPSSQLWAFRLLLPLLRLEQNRPPSWGLSLLVVARRTEA